MAPVAIDDVHTESLQNLLTLVRSKTSPPGCTKIASWDAHSFSAVPHHCSSTFSSLNRKDVIEIQGPSVGKTHLLMHLIITCITPCNHLSVNVGGWNKAAVLLDVDHTFDMRRFRQLLFTRLKRILGQSFTHDAVDQLYFTLLRNLHVFRPNSSFQLASTILNLANYHSSNLPHIEIGLVAIDSMSAFYWQDRLHVEQLRNFGHSSAQKTPSGIEYALKALETFRQSHGPIIVITNWGLNQLSKSSPFYKQHIYQLHSPFNSNPNNNKPVVFLPITHHITLRSAPVPVIEAQTDLRIERDRQEVVEALVRTVGSSIGVGKFTFSITETDIVIG